MSGKNNAYALLKQEDQHARKVKELKEERDQAQNTVEQIAELVEWMDDCMVTKRAVETWFIAVWDFGHAQAESALSEIELSLEDAFRVIREITHPDRKEATA